MDDSVIVVVLVMALHLFGAMSGSPCTLKQCECIKDTWTYFSQDNKFIKVNKAAENFSTSALLCEKLGGQLLIIRDAKTQAFVEDLLVKDDPLRKTEAQYWIGLTRKGPLWKWIDGSNLLAKEYKSRLNLPTTGHMCVEILWPGQTKWMTENCALERHYICEASRPCSRRPVISINSVAMRKGDDVFLTKKREVEVICFVPNYSGQVKKVTIDCPDGQTMSSKWNWASLALNVRLSMHGNKCACTSTLRDQSTERSQVTLGVLHKPFLLDKRDNDKSVYMRALSVIKLEVKIHSNPEPYMYQLFKDKVKMGMDKFQVVVRRLEEPFHYAVEIVMTHDRGARYKMMIGNGVDGFFEYRFHPVVHAAAIMDEAERKCSPISLIVTYIAVAAFLFMALVFLWTDQAVDIVADDKDIIGARKIQWYYQFDTEWDASFGRYDDDRSTQPRSSISITDLNKLRYERVQQIESNIRNNPA